MKISSSVFKSFFIWVSAIALSLYIIGYFGTKTEITYIRIGFVAPSAKELNEQTAKRLAKIEKAPLDETEHLEIVRRTKKILTIAPLDDKSLLYFIFLEANWLTNPKSFELLQEAKIRNPRNRNILKALLTLAQTRSDYSAMLAEIDILFRIDDDSKDQYLNWLSQLFNIEEGREAINLALLDNPKWAPQLLERKIDEADGKNALQLKNSLDIYRSISNQIGVANKLMEKYVNLLIKNKYDELAYFYWKSIYEESPDFKPHKTNLNFNESIKSLDIIPPYNWSLTPSYAGSVNFEPNGGLYASFNARRSVTFAEKYFPWPAERGVKIIARFSYEYEELEGHFSLKLDCIDGVSQTNVGKIVFKNNIKNGKIVSMIFNPTSTERCLTGRLSLVASPGVYGSTISFTLNSVAATAIPITTKQKNRIPLSKKHHNDLR